MNSVFAFPTTTVFAPGALAELPARLQALQIQRPLVVTDAGLISSEPFLRLEETLGKSGRDVSWFVYEGVHPNPIETDVTEAAEAFCAARCDSVVALGGGSPLDVGKATRLKVKRPDLDITQFDWTADWSGLAPLVCIPTTAGTGSEVGRSTVIMDLRLRRKRVLFHPELLAKLVILDPELTRSLPPKLTAATGADALTHCIESFTSPVFHPLCDGIALEGVHLIIPALPAAFADGGNIDARGRMLIAAAMGAVAFQKDLGATHSLAHPLSSLCGMHHGLANAICLPAVMRWNAARKPGLYRRVGLACGLDVVRENDRAADARTIEFITRWLSDLGLGVRLRDFGVTAARIPELAAQAIEDSCHRTNPVPVTRGDLEQLYEAAR